MIVLGRKEGPPLTDLLRRRLLAGAAALPFAGRVAALEPTPGCGPQAAATPSQTEGPYFLPGTPERASLLEADSPPERLTLDGIVVLRGCRPAAGALLEFWHCDEQGVYDNSGFRYRGHQYADRDGRFRLLTIFPAIYPGRARHVHVKVQAPRGPVLTTQLYFPGDARDGLWRRELVVAMARAGTARQAAFRFVVDA
jgi:protocatechuate 3,4-dioxygenase beta subunit